ncbi:MAG TPA: hypothetical protein VKY51_04790 [Fredinandcohnia sp.]|nr:hypothetical protein [Fredinandcohnia sp.]
MEGIVVRALVLLIALALALVLQEIALRLRAKEGTSWWVSNGRDVANALALALLWSAIRIGAGASWPLALLLAGSITLFLTALARALLDHPASRWKVVAVVGVVMVAPLIGAPERVVRLGDAFLAWLYPT